MAVPRISIVTPLHRRAPIRRAIAGETLAAARLPHHAVRRYRLARFDFRYARGH